jgi:hypothetical protein
MNIGHTLFNPRLVFRTTRVCVQDGTFGVQQLLLNTFQSHIIVLNSESHLYSTAVMSLYSC